MGRFYPDTWRQPGVSSVVIFVSCWVPRTRMHLDEIDDSMHTLNWPESTEYSRTSEAMTWTWTQLQVEELSCQEVRVVLDSGGHLFVTAGLHLPNQPDADQAALAAFVAWSRSRYAEILSRWTVLHADVLRGVVNIGKAGLIGRLTTGELRVGAADPAHLTGQVVSVDRVHPMLFTEACRQFIYSTTARFRQFGAELNRIRDDVIHTKIGNAEHLSVTANQRSEDSRTARCRLEIAVQTLRNRLDNYPEQVGPYRQDLIDLILVAEHMQTVWATQERNFEWVVQHVNLRVGISERGATRTFTAAVFSVACVALMRDVVESSLTVGIIEWSVYRVLVLILGSLAVVSTSYLLFLAAKRLVR